MAAKNANDILSLILNQVTQLNANVKKSSLKKNDPMMSNMTDPVPSPVQKTSKLSDVAGSLKALSTINPKDVAKITIMPLGLIALKIKKFTNSLSEITQENIDNSAKALNGLSTLLSTISALDIIKLNAKLKFFPTEKLNKFVVESKDIIILFSKMNTDTIEKAKKSFNAFSSLLSNISMMDIVKLNIKLKIFPAKKLNEFAKNPKDIFNSFSKIDSEKIKKAKDSLSAFKDLLGIIADINPLKISMKILLFPKKLIISFIKGIGEILDSTYNVLTKKFNAKKQRELEKSLKGIKTFTKDVIKTLSGMALIAVIGIVLLPMIVLGFGITILTLLAFNGLSKLMNIIGNEKQAKKNTQNIKNILLFAGGSILILLASFGIGKLIATDPKALLLGLVGVAAVIVMFGGIAFLLGKLQKTLTKAVIPMLIVIGFGALSLLMLYGTIEVSKKMKEAGGWKTLGPALGALAAIVGEYAALALALGALMMIPVLPLVMGAGIATMIGLGLAGQSVAKAALDIIQLGKDVKQTSVQESMSTLTSFIDAMVPLMTSVADLSLKINFRKIHRTIRALNDVISAMSKFSLILGVVGGEAGFMKSIEKYDEKGNPIYNPKGIDIKLTSENLASGFATFVDIVITKLDELKDKVVSSNTIYAIKTIMDPVAKFTEILKAFSTGEDGKIKIINIGEDGKVISKEIIDIKTVSSNIASGFSTFTTTMITEISSMNASFNDLQKTVNVANMFTPIMNLVESMKNILDSNSRKQYEDNLNTLKTTIPSLKTDIYDHISGLKNIRSGGVNPVKQLGRTLNSFIESMLKSFKNSEERDSFVNNVNAAASGVEKINNLYINEKTNSLLKTVPSLTKYHTDFISKLSTSLKDVRDPLDKYTSSVERLANAYDKLKSAYDEQGHLVLTLDESNVTNNEYKMDKNSMDGISELIDGIAPKVGQEMSKVMNTVTISVPARTFGTEQKEAELELSAS